MDFNYVLLFGRIPIMRLIKFQAPIVRLFEKKEESRLGNKNNGENINFNTEE